MSSPLQQPDVSTQLAKSLARVWTSAEREAWRILEQGILGYTFRRHAMAEGALVGFYCPELGIIIQLDGEGGVAGAAQQETRILEGVPLTVIRMPAAHVNRNAIVEAIERAVKPGRLWPED
jgi:very-short-patch-repair endonuclease